MKTILIVGILLFTVSGCRREYTENYQAMTVRTGTDTATTVYAHEQDLTGTDMEGLAEWAKELEEFLSNGHLEIVAAGSLGELLVNRTPERFQPIMEHLLTQAMGRRVDVAAATGQKILRMLRESVHGVRTAAERWVPEPEACEGGSCDE